jgi:co-chaperonin GroES (HSP10)
MTWKVPTLADCSPGIEPTEFACLLAMAEKQEKTSGGILLPEATVEKEGWGSTHARLLAVSALAFSYTDRTDWNPPRVGDVVFTGRFPGNEVIGRDGKSYRLCSDREISGIIERAGAQETERADAA